MRVMMVSPYSLSRPGGVQGQVLGLARELRAIGIDVRVLGPCDGPPPAPGITSVGPSVNWENNGSLAPIAADSAAARRTLDALRDVEPDVVHLHEPVVPGPTLTALVSFAGPLVGTFHIAGEVGRAYLMPAARAAMNRLAVRVAVSVSARRTANAAYPGDFEVLWNGIEVERFAKAHPEPSPVPAVLFVGRHEPRKGLGVLLDAWRHIDRRAVLWVAGEGPQTAELRGRGVPGVEWLGRIDDAERDRRLAGASVFCAPALGGESFGVVLLEAMAAGTPVVASAIDGYANVARGDRDALLFPSGDADALRVTLQRVLDDPALQDRLVEGGRARAEEFSMAKLARAYADCYERARKLHP